MHKFAIVLAICCSSSSVCAGEWISLFDGKSLRGWIQKNGTATYDVVDGSIRGTTTEGSPNSFLCSEKEYGDFELEFEVRVHDQLNSGVRDRSQTKAPEDDERFGRVYGPQVEIEASGPHGGEAGYVYGEATGLGWLTPEDRLKPHKIFENGEWNKYRVVAKGATITTWINGQMIDELHHEGCYKTHPKGFIGLQVHSIGSGTGPFDVTWRNIRIKQLD